MNIRYLILLIIFHFNINAQHIYTSDGVDLGTKQDFVNSCSEAAQKNKSAEYDFGPYCSCICDQVIPTITHLEFRDATVRGKISELFLSTKNLKLIKNCMFEEVSKIEDQNKKEKLIEYENFKKITIFECVKEMQEDNKLDFFIKDRASEYCNCAFENIISKDLSQYDLKGNLDEHSILFNEIFVPCMNGNLKQKPYSNEFNSNDILGQHSSSKILLLDYLGRGYKLKININGIEKYFLFDTGANDLMIDEEFEKELIQNGRLKKENYFEFKSYLMANNTETQGKIIKLNNVSLGNYTLNNVYIGIIKNSSLLCGKSFLDKFRKWEFDKESKILTIYK